MRRLLLVACAAYLSVAAYLVLWPQPDTPDETVLGLTRALAWAGIPSVSSGLVEFLLNIALFVPLTAFGVLLWPRVHPLVWLLLGIATTFAIELVQYAALPDRTAAVSDLVANTLGASVGVALGLAIRWRSGRRTSRATAGR